MRRGTRDVHLLIFVPPRPAKLPPAIYHIHGGGTVVGSPRMALLARDRGKLRGLPPTYIGVGSLDLFVEEDVEYARRLMRSGVSVECHVYAGAVHGSDCLPGALGAQFAEAFRGATARLLQK